MKEVAKRTVSAVDELDGFFVTGTVVGANTWTETHVSSITSGGGSGGHIYQGSGYVNNTAPTTTVSSTVTEVNRFFLQSDEQEEKIEIRGGDFAVRNGHVVSVIRIGAKDGDWAWNLAYLNHSTGNLYAEEKWLKWPVRERPRSNLLVAGLGGLVLSILWLVSVQQDNNVGMEGYDAALGIVASLALLVVGVLSRNKNLRKYRQLIEAVRARRQQEIEAAKAAHAAPRLHAVPLERAAS